LDPPYAPLHQYSQLPVIHLWSLLRLHGSTHTYLDALQSANGRNTHSMLLDTRPNGSDTHFDALEYAYARLTNCPFTASLVCRAMSE
jgi:hypothetical protein